MARSEPLRTTRSGRTIERFPAGRSEIFTLRISWRESLAISSLGTPLLTKVFFRFVW